MTNTVHTSALLLERVPVITNTFKEKYLKAGLTYNIFKIAGIGEREIIVCRVLADLLNPKGLHNQGSTFLGLFMDMVVKPFIEKTANFDLSKAKVITEYQIKENRRIDIVLDDGTIFIPIEVKINAGEQENQLADYAVFSRQINVLFGFIPVLFLTPSGYESDETAKDDYIPISFEKHIIPWLVKCLDQEGTQRTSSVKEIIKQFVRTIKSFCGHAEDEDMENAINNLITESKDSYAAALVIHQAVNELDFDHKTCGVFKEQITRLVKNKFPDAKYLVDGESDDQWNCLDIPIGKGCKLRINYDMKSLTVEYHNSKSVPSDIAEKMRKTMSATTRAHNEDWGGDFIWASDKYKYPGLEDIDDDRMYIYELHRIYSKEPQFAADKIVSMAMGLKNI